MNSNKIFKRFKFKIIFNSLVNSLIYGLINGFVITTIISIILYFNKIKNIGLAFIIFGVIVITFTIFSYFKFFKVTKESIAKTLDELGLDERIITMLEYQNIDNDITILQRNDAVMKLNNVNPKDIKIKVQKLSLIVLIVTLFIFGSSFFLPKPSAHGTGENPGGELIEPSEDDLIIKEMLAKLREIIDNAAVEQELKNRLHALVDELEEDLKVCSTTNEKVSLIKQAMKRIEEIIEYYLTERYMGEALQMYDPFTNIDFLTAPLGIAVSEKDLLGVDISLDVFKEQLLLASKKRSTEFETLRDEYVKNLDEALKRATLEENEALITAIQNFKDNLSTATPDNIVEVIEVAKEEIKKALMEDPSGTKEPEASEDMKEEMQDAMQDALDQLEKDEQEEEDEIETDDSQTDGEQESDNKQETPPPPVPDEPLDSEPIIDGNTPYLPEYEKYAEIINQILASYEGEEIPEDVKKVIEEYLKMLK